MSWIKNETALLETTGNEPDVFPDQIRVLLTYIDATNHVRHVRRTEIATGLGDVHCLEGNQSRDTLVHWIRQITEASVSRQGQTWTLQEVLFFAAPVRAETLDLAAEADPFTMATASTTVIRPTDLGTNMQLDAMLERTNMSPFAHLDALRIYAFFRPSTGTDTSEDDARTIDRTVRAWRPGMRTRRKPTTPTPPSLGRGAPPTGQKARLRTGRTPPLQE